MSVAGMHSERSSIAGPRTMALGTDIHHAGRFLAIIEGTVARMDDCGTPSRYATSNRD